MNLVEYFCSVEGLVSMWFGLSIYDIALIFVIYLKMKITLIFDSILENFRENIPTIFKFKEMISSKMNQIFSIITIIIFSSLMLIQIIEVIAIYLDFEIVTRFEVQETKLLPNITLWRIICITLLMNCSEYILN